MYNWWTGVSDNLIIPKENYIITLAYYPNHWGHERVRFSSLSHDHDEVGCATSANELLHCTMSHIIYCWGYVPTHIIYAHNHDPFLHSRSVNHVMILNASFRLLAKMVKRKLSSSKSCIFSEWIWKFMYFSAGSIILQLPSYVQMTFVILMNNLCCTAHGELLVYEFNYSDSECNDNRWKQN